MTKSRTSSAGGFTLVELLIVIAIVGLLISLSIPAIQASREAARRAQCVNNQRQYGIAFANFESQNKVFPSSYTARIKGPLSDIGLQMRNYVVDLLPFLEEPGIDSQYHRDAMFSAPENAAAIASVLNIAVCPSSARSDFGLTPTFKLVPSLAFNESARSHSVFGPLLAGIDKKYSTSFRGAVTDYSIPSGADDGVAGLFGYNPPKNLRSLFPPLSTDEKQLAAKLLAIVAGSGEIEFTGRLRAAQVTDGLSHTFILTEVSGRPERWQMGARTQLGEPLSAAWADPSTIFRINGFGTETEKCLLQCDNDDEIYSFHPGGVNFLFADSHVEYVETSTDGRIVLAWLTPDEGDNQ